MDRLRAAISARIIGSLPLRVHDRLRPANAVVLAVAMLLTATVAGPTSAAAEPDGPVSIGVPTTDGLIAGLGTARVPVTLDAELEDGTYSVQVRVAPGTGTLRIPEDSTVTSAGSLPTGRSAAASSIAFAGELAFLRAALEDLHFTPADPDEPAPTELRVDVAATIPTIAGRDLYYNPANGHVYEHVRLGSPISWQDARTAAAGRTFERSGLPDLVGHLATITTADEAAFVADVIAEPNTWIGASDDAFVVGEARGAPVFRITHVERPRKIFNQSWDLILTLDRPHPYSNATDFAIWSSVIFDGLDVDPFFIADVPNRIALFDVPGTDRLTLFIASTTAPRTEVTGDARLTGRVGLGGTVGILRTEGDWYWVDGPEVGQRVADGHTAWASGQPTSSSGTAIAVTSDGWKNLEKDDASITGYLVEYSGSIDLPTFSGSRWIVPHAPSRLRTSAPTDDFDVRLAWNAAAGSGADPAIRYEYSFDDATWLPAGGADARAVQFDLPSGVTDACNGNVLVRAAIGPFASSGVLTSSGPLCPTPSIVVAAPTEVAGSPGVFEVPITPNDFDPSQNYAAFLDVPAGDAELSLTVTTGLSPAFDFAAGTFRRIGGDRNELGFIGTYAEVTAALASVRVTQLRTPGAGIRVNATLTTAPPEDEGGSSFYYFPENGHYYQFVDTGSEITWKDARDAAAAETLFGMEGYLVTITSLSESRFVNTQIDAPNIWMGASDDFEVVNAARGDSFYSEQRTGGNPSEGRWYWVTGPEAGQQFWELSDPADFSSQERRDVAGGQAVDGAFSAWCDNEPNNRETSTKDEHYGAANYECGGRNHRRDAELERLHQRWEPQGLPHRVRRPAGRRVDRAERGGLARPRRPSGRVRCGRRGRRRRHAL